MAVRQISTHEISVQQGTVPTSMLPVAALSPNDYNPNHMTQAEFAELVAEVRHLGRVPKPIIVRPNGDGYVIVDGEHGWRAATEVGLAEVPCEVIDVDDFEAMRQTYKRNQHGTHNAVLLGRMFRRMLAERELSQRALATEMEVSEGTVRNALLYAEAADLRNGYAATPEAEARRARASQIMKGYQPPSPDDDVARLSIRLLREYLKLPSPIGDIWVSAGASLELLKEAGRVLVTDGAGYPYGRGKKQQVQFYDPEPVHPQGDELDVGAWRALVDAGLHTRLQPGRFVESARWAFEFLHWRERYGRHIDADAYVRAVFDAGLPPMWLEQLPCTVEHGVARPAISAEAWAQIMEQAETRSETHGECLQLIEAGLGLALRSAGLTKQDTSDPRVGLMLSIVRDAPAFIREAAIPQREQAAIAQARPTMYTAPEDAVIEAKRRAVRLLEEQHAFVSGHNALPLHEHITVAIAEYEQARAGSGRWRGTPKQAFSQSLDEVMRERQQAELGLSFADSDRLMGTVVRKLRQQYGLQDSTVSTLVTRFQRLPPPEWLLLASFVLDDKRGAMKRYLAAIRSDATDPRPAAR